MRRCALNILFGLTVTAQASKNRSKRSPPLLHHERQDNTLGSIYPGTID
jgi:hypothetical protein